MHKYNSLLPLASLSCAGGRALHLVGSRSSCSWDNMTRGKTILRWLAEKRDNEKVFEARIVMAVKTAVGGQVTDAICRLIHLSMGLSTRGSLP